MPVQNRNALRMRNSLSCTSVLPGEDDGADERGEEEHGDHFERDDVDPEDVLADGAGAAERHQRVAELDLLAAEGVDEQRGEDTEDEEGGDDGPPPLVVVEAGSFTAHLGPGEHDAEQEEDDDGADVDEDLDPGHELGGQQDVLGRGASEDDDEEP